MFINVGLDFDENHDHDSLPGLTWVSPDNDKLISFRIAEFVDNCWDIIAELPWKNVDEELLSRIYNFDFGCCNARNVHTIANWFAKNVGLLIFLYRCFVPDVNPGYFKQFCTHRTVRPQRFSTSGVFPPCDQERSCKSCCISPEMGKRLASTWYFYF